MLNRFGNIKTYKLIYGKPDFYDQIYKNSENEKIWGKNFFPDFGIKPDFLSRPKKNWVVLSTFGT